ncbi:MAG: F0F1 ATP synthase subunit epsilon [Verrucomicrobiota bacterium]
MTTLRLEIVTPEEKIYSEDVEMVTLPGSEGELGIYPRHVPVLTTLKPGELRIRKDGRETSMAIGEGFVEVKGDAVSVLTDMALQAEKIDVEAAEAAVERAKAAMKEDLGKEEVAAVQASLQKALAQLHVKRRRHHG